MPSMTQTPPDLPLRARFDASFQASRAQPEVPLALRRDRLRRMQAVLDNHGAALSQAIAEDFGVRSSQLTQVADLFVLRALMHQLDRRLPAWMRARRVSTPFYLRPASARILRQPLGVVGVMSPWNYPVQLALGPAATALAAGNRVMLKPSEWTPRTSACMAQCLQQAFAPDELDVVQGGPEVAEAFAQLPFDHLFFTGSTAVGRRVAEAAARNLTPTTLELGGKSPCILDRSANLDDAARKIVHGKLLNAGQTCIAPDYVLLPRGLEAAFEAAWQRAVSALFPTLGGNPDYASVVSERHHRRLLDLLDEARESGARVVEAQAPDASAAGHARQMRPALVWNPHATLRLMQEEIFGPVLPVLPCDTPQEAIAFINARPRPLALYWFGDDPQARDHVLACTVSGGVSVNDTLMHIAHENLPFGGVGESGWGAYHGEEGFLRFTHRKSVLLQSRWSMGHLFHPPYGPRFDRLMGLLSRWV